MTDFDLCSLFIASSSDKSTDLRERPQPPECRMVKENAV